ncbi:hypothetical protein D3C80_1995670 [compost metagenome]
MHQRRQPAGNLVRATVPLLAHEHVDAPVIVVGGVERRDAVFLGPIGFEVSERLVVETADQGHGMRIGLKLAKVLAVLLQ